MSISNYLGNKILTDNLTTSYLSLHTADPGETGRSEVAGGSYSRKPWTFTGPTNGVITSSATVLYTGMPAVTVTHFGVWDAATCDSTHISPTTTRRMTDTNGNAVRRYDFTPYGEHVWAGTGGRTTATRATAALSLDGSSASTRGTRGPAQRIRGRRTGMPHRDQPGLTTTRTNPVAETG